MSGANLPVTIQVQGQQQAEAAFNSVATTGERAMQRVAASSDRATGSARGFGNAVGQAGFQLQDFAVQVQAGTSWMTALSQQGSQLLGVFGTGGAIAGAVLTVGLLAASFLGASNNAEELKRAQDTLANSLKAANEYFDTQIARAQRLATEHRNNAIQAIAAANAIRMVNQSRLAEQLLDYQSTEDQARLARELGGPDTAIPENVRRRLAIAQRIRGEMDILRGDIETADRQLADLRAGRGSGDVADRTLELRRGLDERFRIQEDYQNRLRQLRESVRAGALSSAEATRLETLALRERDKALRDMANRGGRVNDGSGTAQGVYQTIQWMREQRDQEVADAKRGMAGVGDEAQRTTSIVRDLGMTFTSAFEDAIVRGRSLRDVLGGIAEDIGRIVLRQTVTTPLANALSGVVGNLFGGGGSGGSFSIGKLGGIFSTGGTKGLSATPVAVDVSAAFANGGIMTANGPIPLRMYARGGVANGPQMAMFGEGSTPEAYVPLPDGRAIPVRMEGGGGVTLNMVINAQGAGPREIDALRMQIPAIARAAVEDAARRGGSSARNIRGR